MQPKLWVWNYLWLPKRCLSCCKREKSTLFKLRFQNSPHPLLSEQPAALCPAGLPNAAAVLGKATSAGEVLANCPSLILSAASSYRSARAAALSSSHKTPMSPDASAKLQLHSAQQPAEDLGTRFVQVLCGCACTMHNCPALEFGKCHLVFIFFHSVIHHLHPHRFTVQLPFCFQDNFSWMCFDLL